MFVNDINKLKKQQKAEGTDAAVSAGQEAEPERANRRGKRKAQALAAKQTAPKRRARCKTSEA